MALHYGWWIAAVVLVIAELMTGSLYLLALAAGAAAAGALALVGLDFGPQLLCAAAVAVALCFVVHKVRGKRTSLPSQENPDVLMDVGASIHVAQWKADQTARVQHRGTDWDARCKDSVASAGWFKIVAIENNQLVLVRDASRSV